VSLPGCGGTRHLLSISRPFAGFRPKHTPLTPAPPRRTGAAGSPYRSQRLLAGQPPIATASAAAEPERLTRDDSPVVR